MNGGPNQGTVDVYTAVHFGAGYAAGEIGVDWRAALAGAIAWEAIEDAIKVAAPDVFAAPPPDSQVNALVDVAAFLFGYVVSIRSEIAT
jgi:hypothetical protein|tara:strand:+ start:75 stop:341 length:267 start_codon:yes stop_codon:yes gene_type:complete